MKDSHTSHGQARGLMSSPYAMLALNLGVSLIVMYVAMFAMIDDAGEFVQNLNFFYMALVMWAPMGVVMMLTMGHMYENRRLNAGIYLALAIVFLASLVGIRQQGLVGDRQFLRSMLPHHSGAVLMCKRAALSDPEVRELCFGEAGIVASQDREIRQMKQILDRL